MNHNDQDRLLTEVLTDEVLQACRLATLECGLAGMRRHRRHRRAVKVCSVVGLVIIGAVAAVCALKLADRVDPTMAGRLAAPPNLASDSNSNLKVITDEELFALFPDRPLALVGKPGHQQLVFLDEPRAIGVGESTKREGL